jgi:hypothetical protein
VKISRTVPLALAATLTAGAALASPETSPNRPPMNITGKVDGVFGRQIVVATDTAGKVLVDVGRHSMQPPISVGEALKVTGRAEGSRLEATSLTRADGSTVVLRGEEHRHGQRGKAAGMAGNDD